MLECYNHAGIIPASPPNTCQPVVLLSSIAFCKVEGGGN